MNAARNYFLLHPGRSQIIDNTLRPPKSSKKLQLRLYATPGTAPGATLIFDHVTASRSQEGPVNGVI